MKTRLLSKKQMQGLLSMAEVVELCARTFADEARGGVDCPAKVPTRLMDAEGRPAGTVSVMPAFVGWQRAAGCKFIGGNTGRRSRGLPYIYASQLMIDPASGDLTGVMDAEYLTQMRTGAQTGAALRFMKGQEPAAGGAVRLRFPGVYPDPGPGGSGPNHRAAAV